MLAALGGRYKAIAPDLPGHGAFAARPASFPACDAYVRALARRPVVLAGYSMGGRIALHAALAPGAPVARLVLVAASPGLADPAERAARRRSDDALARPHRGRSGVDAFVREWAAQPLFAGMPRGRRPSRPTPIAAATRPPGSPRRCAGSAPA